MSSSLAAFPSTRSERFVDVRIRLCQKHSYSVLTNGYCVISHNELTLMLQGLYAMSINCMEAAEAQFKTALMVFLVLALSV